MLRLSSKKNNKKLKNNNNSKSIALSESDFGYMYLFKLSFLH